MRRLLAAALALLWLALAPAYALTPAQIAPVSSACVGVKVSVAYVGNGANCLNGTRYTTPMVPGWTFTRASSETCVWSNGTTTTAGNNVPCITDLGLAVWQASTNLLLNSATLSTQNITTSATSYTISCYGTGSITLSGTATGTVSCLASRGVLTVTATSGTLTLTVSGTVTNAQAEALAFATPYIPTTGTTASRSADAASITGLSVVSPYTLIGKAQITATAVNNGLAATSDASDFVNLYRLNVPTAGAQIRVAGTGVYSSSISISNVTGALTIGYALNGSTLVGAAYFGGSVLQENAGTGGVPTATTLTLGGGFAMLNGYVQRVQVLNVALGQPGIKTAVAGF